MKKTFIITSIVVCGLSVAYLFGAFRGDYEGPAEEMPYLTQLLPNSNDSDVGGQDSFWEDDGDYVGEIPGSPVVQSQGQASQDELNRRLQVIAEYADKFTHFNFSLVQELERISALKKQGAQPGDWAKSLKNIYVQQAVMETEEDLSRIYGEGN